MKIMALTLKNWSFFFILGLGIILYAVYGLKISTAYFRINNRNKDFKKCIGTILNKPEHGMRVSELTGKCEKTTSDDIREAGYSYAETVIMEKKLTLPELNMEKIIWHNSKGIGKGFRFDMQWSEPIAVDDPLTAIAITFTNASHRLVLEFYQEAIHVFEEKIIVDEQELQTSTMKTTLHQRQRLIFLQRTAIVKLSILTQSESVKIMFDNEDFWTYEMQTVNISNMHHFSVKLKENFFSNKILLLHGYRLSVE